MGKFEMAAGVGLRDKDTEKLIAVYPFKAEGADNEIAEKVKSWYYKQSCIAEDNLRHAYVDTITENESREWSEGMGCYKDESCSR